MSVMEELVQLERAIDQLARSWERFLAHEAGAAMPTLAELDALEQRLRQLALRDAVSPVERGRLQQLSSHLAVKSASWRRLVPQDSHPPSAAPAPKERDVPPQTAPAGRAEAQIGPAMMEEYRRLFARYQAAIERAGEPNPLNFGRFVQEVEAQRQRLTARGIQVDGFDVVREPSGVRVRPRTRAGGR